MIGWRSPTEISYVSCRLSSPQNSCHAFRLSSHLFRLCSHFLLDGTIWQYVTNYESEGPQLVKELPNSLYVNSPVGRSGIDGPPKQKKMSLKASKSLGLYVQKRLDRTGIEFHWPEYQYMGPSTHLKIRLKLRDPVNRLDRIAKQNDNHNSSAENLRNKHAANQKMIKAIDLLVLCETEEHDGKDRERHHASQDQTKFERKRLIMFNNWKRQRVTICFFRNVLVSKNQSRKTPQLIYYCY